MLSGTEQVSVNNVAAPARPGTVSGPSGPSQTAATTPIQLTYPRSGQALSGLVEVAGAIAQTLDPAGSYLLVDGVEAGWRRVSSAPYVYELDTGALAEGQHSLQIWAHDIANETLLSNVATVLVSH